MFGLVRNKWKMPTRRPHERPTGLKAQTKYPDGRIETFKVSLDDIPPMILGINLPRPGLLVGGSPSDVPKDVKGVCYTNPEAWKKIGGGKRIQLPIVQLKIDSFVRMIAKIAHSYIVSHYGIGNFRPLLPDLILGKNKLHYYLVGGYDPDAPETPEADHQLLALIPKVNGQHYVAAGVRLFSRWGMPTYLAMVGETDGEIKPIRPFD
jgi:hypothetical protein